MSERCNAPHPDNDYRPSAHYFAGGHSSVPGISNQHRGMFCQREHGHEGRHACYRPWANPPGWGETHEWGGDLSAGDKAMMENGK